MLTALLQQASETAAVSKLHGLIVPHRYNLSPLPSTALTHWWMKSISDEYPSLHNQREGKQIIFYYMTLNMQAVRMKQEV